MSWRDAIPSEGLPQLAVVSPHGSNFGVLVSAFKAGLHRHANVQEFLCTDTDFPDCIRHLRECNFVGAWINNPFKIQAGRLSEGFSVNRETMGLANVLDLRGGVTAYNTEINAINQLLKDLQPATALVLGCGQAARSSVMALYQLGWKVRVWNRSARKAQPFKTLFARYGQTQVLYEPDPTGCALVINATPLGARAGEQPPLLWKFVRPKTVFLDMVTRQVPTDFLRNAANRGLPIIDGRLVQAEAAIEGAALLGLETNLRMAQRQLGLSTRSMPNFADGRYI